MEIETQLDYQEFRQQYEFQHPASVPVLEFEMGEYPTWVKWAVLAMFVSASLLSAVHTVPTVFEGMQTGIVAEWVRQGVALMSFVAIELAILLTAYLLVRRSPLAWIVLAVTFTVAVVANLHSVSKAMTSDDLGTKIVGVVLGLAAPLITLMAGKLFVTIFRSDRNTGVRSRQLFHEASVKFDAEVLAAWKTYQRPTRRRALADGQTVRQLSAVSLSDGRTDNETDGQADGRGHGYGQGYNKRTDARAAIAAHLEAYPADLQMNVRDLAAKLGVGKTTVSEVIREIKNAGGGQ